MIEYRREERNNKFMQVIVDVDEADDRQKGELLVCVEGGVSLPKSLRNLQVGPEVGNTQAASIWQIVKKVLVVLVRLLVRLKMLFVRQLVFLACKHAKTPQPKRKKAR
jgi:hypothetical protein